MKRLEDTTCPHCETKLTFIHWSEFGCDALCINEDCIYLIQTQDKYRRGYSFDGNTSETNRI